MYILFLFLSSLALADDKQELYFVSCTHTFIAISKAAKQISSNELIPTANSTCKEMSEALTKGKKWDQVKDPDFDGCVDAIHVLSVPEERKVVVYLCSHLFG